MTLPCTSSPNLPQAFVSPAGALPRQEPPSPVQSCGINKGPREDALGGVQIPALSPEAEITGRKCFCVASASFLLAPLFLSTKAPLCKQLWRRMVQTKRIYRFRDTRSVMLPVLSMTQLFLHSCVLSRTGEAAAAAQRDVADSSENHWDTKQSLVAPSWWLHALVSVKDAHYLG